MFSSIKNNKILYILANLLVIPAGFIPKIDLFTNIAFLSSILFLFKTKILSILLVCILFILKNNANYRFKLLLKSKGENLSKSDAECVYLYAWSTFLRYSIIGLVIYEYIAIYK